MSQTQKNSPDQITDYAYASSLQMDETLVIHVGKGSEHKIHLLFTPVQLDVLRDTQRDGIGLREF